MNDEYIYQYPAPEYMENFKEMVAQRTTNTNGARKKVIVCFGISMAFLVLYCLPFLNFIDTYLLLVVSFQAKCKKVRYYRYFPLGRVTLN